MSDDRGNGGGEGTGEESDGLDVWFAANFPPKKEDEPAATPPAAPAPPVTPPTPAEPGPPPPVTPTQPPTDPQWPGGPQVPPPSTPPSAPPSAQPPIPPPPPVVNPPWPVIPPATPGGPLAPPSPVQPPAVQQPAAPPPAAPLPAAPLPGALPPVVPPGSHEVPPSPVSPTSGHPIVPPMAEELGGVPVAPEFPPPPTEAFAESAGPAGIDSLFGESRFRDYEEEPDPSENPFVGGATKSKAERPAGISKAQKVLMWVAASLVALLALLALFFVGTKLPDLLGPGPEVVALPTSTPTPTPTEVPLGPVEPGDYRWDDLLGGECLNNYAGPWAQEYTVVDCAEPHQAQLAIRGTFLDEDGVGMPYPGIEGLESQVNLLCTAPTVINYVNAATYDDIQFEASFAATIDDWVSGDKHYYCFLSRSGGGQIDLDIAQPQVAPTPSPEPTESSAP